MILYLKFWAFFYCRRRCVFAWSSIQKRNPPANDQLLLTTSCRSRCQLSVFTHTYTSYLPSCLHSRNLRPRNFTSESVQISDKRLCFKYFCNRKILHLAKKLYTPPSCDGCDKYEVSSHVSMNFKRELFSPTRQFIILGGYLLLSLVMISVFGYLSRPPVQANYRKICFAT